MRLDPKAFGHDGDDLEGIGARLCRGGRAWGDERGKREKTSAS
jgi:hypothetical protein